MTESAPEGRINKLLDMLDEMVTVSGQNEKTKIIPNCLVINSVPADLPSNYIIVENEDGFYIPAVKVAGLSVNNGDYVNILYIAGTEPIAMQQGSGSPSTGGDGTVKVSSDDSTAYFLEQKLYGDPPIYYQVENDAGNEQYHNYFYISGQDEIEGIGGTGYWVLVEEPDLSLKKINANYFLDAVSTDGVWPKANTIMWDGVEYASIDAACAAATYGAILIGPGSYTWNLTSQLQANVIMVGSDMADTIITIASDSAVIVNNTNIIKDLKLQKTRDVENLFVSMVQLAGGKLERVDIYFWNTDTDLVQGSYGIELTATGSELNDVICWVYCDVRAAAIFAPAGVSYWTDIKGGYYSSTGISSSESILVGGSSTHNFRCYNLPRFANDFDGFLGAVPIMHYPYYHQGKLQNYGIASLTEDTPANGYWMVMDVGTDDERKIDSYYFINDNITAQTSNELFNFCTNAPFEIDQEGNAGGITADGHIVDQWQLFESVSSGTVTGARGTTRPTNPKSPYSLSLTVASGTYAAGSYGVIQYPIEGYFIQPLILNDSFMVSFQVMSTVTGDFGFSIRDGGTTVSYVVPLSLTASTWQSFNILVPKPTIGTWTSDNAARMLVVFSLIGGSTYQTSSLNQWVSGNYLGPSTMTNPANATLYITEPMVSPVSYLYKSNNYSFDLTWVLRYFEKSWDLGIAIGTASEVGMTEFVGTKGGTASSEYFVMRPEFLVKKRTAPTITVYDQSSNSGRIAQRVANSSLVGNITPAAVDQATERNFRIIDAINQTTSAGMAAHWVANARM